MGVGNDSPRGAESSIGGAVLHVIEQTEAVESSPWTEEKIQHPVKCVDNVVHSEQTHSDTF